MLKDINLRKEYTLGGIDENSVPSCPFELFKVWFEQATQSNIIEPNAMALATCSLDNKPSVRFVLAKGISEKGICFYTNYSSRKGKELLENPNASIVFYWDALERQVRIEGVVKKLSTEQSDLYFLSRPEQAQLGAIVSRQSEIVSSRDILEEEFEQEKITRANSKLKRPENWGGFIIEPSMYEFWQGRVGRLHDRIRYQFIQNNWQIDRLYP